MIDDRVRESVLATVQAMMEAYSARDLAGVLAHFADSDELTCIGSGPKERSVGFNELKADLLADFDEAQPMAVEVGWNNVSFAPLANGGDIAWAAAQLRFQVEADLGVMSISARLTAVLTRASQDDPWLIMQSHLSLPFPREDE